MAEKQNIVSVDDATGLATFEIKVTDRDKTVVTSFTAPKDAETFKRYVQGATGETLAEAYKHFMYGANLKARAAARESTASIKPEIVVKGVRINLVSGDTLVVAVEQEVDGQKKLVDLSEPKQGPTLPPAKRAAMINAALAQAEAFGTEPAKAIVAARDALVEKGWPKAADGTITARNDE